MLASTRSLIKAWHHDTASCRVACLPGMRVVFAVNCLQEGYICYIDVLTL